MAAAPAPCGDHEEEGNLEVRRDAQVVVAEAPPWVPGVVGLVHGDLEAPGVPGVAVALGSQAVGVEACRQEEVGKMEQQGAAVGGTHLSCHLFHNHFDQLRIEAETEVRTLLLPLLAECHSLRLAVEEAVGVGAAPVHTPH